jgi:hypothetical protein
MEHLYIVEEENARKRAKEIREDKLHMDITERPKLCINCRHCIKINLLFAKEYYCGNTVIRRANLVTGKQTTIKKDTCEEERIGDPEIHCGIQAQYFEEKIVKNMSSHNNNNNNYIYRQGEKS